MSILRRKKHYAIVKVGRRCENDSADKACAKVDAEGAGEEERGAARIWKRTSGTRTGVPRRHGFDRGVSSIATRPECQWVKRTLFNHLVGDRQQGPSIGCCHDRLGS
jgi:hypothetical protein